MRDIIKQQKLICKKYGAGYRVSPPELKIGISLNVKNGEQPIHGLRHFPSEGTSGWYIWAGEYSDDPDFFQPLHIEHLDSRCPVIIPYLGLEPGYRFLIAENDNYIDVWEDLSLLDDIDR